MKKALLIIVSILMVFALSGCMKKDVITTEDFIKEAEKQGYTIYDVKEQYKEYEYIKEATVAKKDNYQIEFYVLDTKKDAKNMFSSNIETLECSSYGEVNMINYSTYACSHDELVAHLSRVENTFLYADNNEEYDKDVIKLIKALGYL